MACDDAEDGENPQTAHHAVKTGLKSRDFEYKKCGAGRAVVLYDFSPYFRVSPSPGDLASPRSIRSLRPFSSFLYWWAARAASAESSFVIIFLIDLRAHIGLIFLAN